MKPMGLKHFSPWALRMKVTTWDFYGRPQQKNDPTGLVIFCVFLEVRSRPHEMGFH